MTYLPLVRFSKKEYLEQLQSGRLFMRNIMYYQDLEETDTARSDVYDGSIPFPFIPKVANHLEKITNPRILMPMKYVSCFFKYNSIGDTGQLHISQESKKEIIKFGCEYALIIDTNKFIKRLNDLVRSKEPTLNYGDVFYYTDDDYQKEIDRIMSRSLPSQAIEFFKREKYKVQQEFRVSLNYQSPIFGEIFKNPVNDISAEKALKFRETTYTLDIGSIKEFSMLITAQDVLDEKVYMNLQGKEVQ